MVKVYVDGSDGKQFTIPVPSGYKVINFRLPVKGDYYLHHNDISKVIHCDEHSNIPSGPRFIVEKLVKYVTRKVRISDVNVHEPPLVWFHHPTRSYRVNARLVGWAAIYPVVLFNETVSIQQTDVFITKEEPIV